MSNPGEYLLDRLKREEEIGGHGHIVYEDDNHSVVIKGDSVYIHIRELVSVRISSTIDSVTGQVFMPDIPLPIDGFELDIDYLLSL